MHSFNPSIFLQQHGVEERRTDVDNVQMEGLSLCFNTCIKMLTFFNLPTGRAFCPGTLKRELNALKPSMKVRYEAVHTSSKAELSHVLQYLSPNKMEIPYLEQASSARVF